MKNEYNFVHFNKYRGGTENIRIQSRGVYPSTKLLKKLGKIRVTFFIDQQAKVIGIKKDDGGYKVNSTMSVKLGTVMPMGRYILTEEKGGLLIFKFEKPQEKKK